MEMRLGGFNCNFAIQS